MRTLITTVVAGTVLLVGTAGASLTPEACLARKLKEWGKLRKCQAAENAKALEGKPTNLAKCQAKLDMKLASLSQQAADAGIACRYQVNGDGTATDYDTGLMWEQKTDDGSVHDKDNTYSWTTLSGGTKPNGTAFTDFLGMLNDGSSTYMTIVAGESPSGCFAGHCDWRMPSIGELRTIVLAPDLACDSPCIDQTVFGPTAVDNYTRSATTAPLEPPNEATVAWDIHFFNGGMSGGGKWLAEYVRAVRSGL